MIICIVDFTVIADNFLAIWIAYIYIFFCGKRRGGQQVLKDIFGSNKRSKMTFLL